jgi:ABC-type lipopolysaccharide export system ATPase subunit
MKNLVRFSILLVLLISFAGCESEPITDIAKIEKELKAVVKDHGITRCSVVVRDYNFQAKEEFYNTDFTISNGSIIVHGVNYSGAKSERRYNLLQLSSYDFSGNYIYFYF